LLHFGGQHAMNIDEEEFAALRSFTLSPRSTEPMVHMHPTLYSCTSMSTTSTCTFQVPKVTKRNSITETSNRELEKYILYSKWSQDHVTTTHGYLAHHKMCFVEFDPSKIPNFQ
jgi:hypothetical protein